MSFKKVEDVKVPLKKGEFYLVPCFYREEDGKKKTIRNKLWGVDTITGYSKARSVTYQSIANAMAQQWGDYILNL